MCFLWAKSIFSPFFFRIFSHFFRKIYGPKTPAPSPWPGPRHVQRVGLEDPFLEVLGRQRRQQGGQVEGARQRRGAGVQQPPAITVWVPGSARHRDGKFRKRIKRDMAYNISHGELERSELTWHEMHEMNELTWIKWHEWVEMKELKRINGNEWLVMNELESKNWNEGNKVN